MRREFTEDGWRFRVTVHGRGNNPTQRVKVQFHDNTLHNPAVEDVHSIEDTRVGRREEETERGIGPLTWTSTKTVKDPDELPDIEDHVSEAMDKAWDRIEQIEESPSQKVDRAINNYKR